MSVAYETSFTMRGVTGVILQLHQILHLPRKMTVMIDPRHIWNVIYNARSNRSHNPTSPNTAPATQNESHDWSESHMKRHLQCAEQQESQSNFTKHCTCHSKWISWLIRIRYETSFTMRGATRVTLQLQQNTAPATQNASHDWSASHMKRHLECAEQAKSTSNLSKSCACHAKWISWLTRASYETSFPLRRASKVNLQPQQILRLPRKMNPMIDPRHIWNVIANARSKQCHPLTSPNTAPATKSLSSRLQRKLSELLPPIERRFEDNPTMIRAWNRHLAPAASETLLVRPWTRFCIEKYNISRSGYLPKCHQMLRLPRKITLQLHQILRLPRKMHLMIDPRLIWNVI